MRLNMKEVGLEKEFKILNHVVVLSKQRRERERSAYAGSWMEMIDIIFEGSE